MNYCVVGGKAKDLKKIAQAYGCLISKGFKDYDSAERWAINGKIN